MKILYIIDSLKLGGKEKQLYLLIKSFKINYNFEIYLILKNNEIAFPKLATYCEKIYSLDYKPYQLIFKIHEVISEVKPDLIHSFEGGLTSLTIPASKYKNIKLINGEIRYAKKFKTFSKLGFIQKFNTYFSDINISNSEAGLRAFSLVKNHKNKVIYNGFDTDDFENNAHTEEKLKKYLRKNTIVIGKIANFTLPKDYTSAIFAGIQLLQKYENILFVFIGDGPEIDSARRMIPAKFTDKYIFLGSRNDVESLVKFFDICLLLSKKNHSEGLSNSIMEYMAAGLPVICTNTGGNPELITDGENGFLVEHEDVKDIADKIEILINDQELRANMGRISREKIRKNFAINKIAEQYFEVYKSLVS